MPNNSKAKGQLSEARALYEFQKRDIPVCIPWGDNERYDLIAEFNGKFNRIQVKTANEIQNGSVCCYCRSSTNHTTNKGLNTYVNDIDYFVFVNQTYDLLAIVPIEEVGEQKQIRLRLQPPANGQVVNIRYFSDFSFDKLFDNNNEKE